MGVPDAVGSGESSDRPIDRSRRYRTIAHEEARAGFAVRHRVIAFDHRGTGESDKPDAPPYSTRSTADDLVPPIQPEQVPSRAGFYGRLPGRGSAPNQRSVY